MPQFHHTVNPNMVIVWVFGAVDCKTAICREYRLLLLSDFCNLADLSNQSFLMESLSSFESVTEKTSFSPTKQTSNQSCLTNNKTEIVYLLVCHLPFPAQGAVWILHRAGNHMTDQFFRLNTLCTHLSGSNLWKLNDLPNLSDNSLFHEVA